MIPQAALAGYGPLMREHFNLPDNRQIAIQQYIGILERAVLARRWGIE